MFLAGLLPLEPEVSARWGWSGSWVYPVGDPCRLTAAVKGGASPYFVARGLSERDTGGRGHQGVDLSNRSGNGPVCAAGNGLVVSVGAKGWNRGYGRHVVLAHRCANDALVYSVYAHLAPGSVTVSPGQFVTAGRVIGRVGMSGRATSPHLHFEVRATDDPWERWEHARPVDPIAFVAARLRAYRADSGWALPYLEWAECALLIRPSDSGDGPLSRADWWRTLAAATRQPLAALPADDDDLHAALVEAGLLPGRGGDDAHASLEWSEVARDLDRARRFGWRLPWSPVGRQARRARCRLEFGQNSPGHDPEALAHGVSGGPTHARICLLMADLAGDEPRRSKTPKPQRPPLPHPG